MIIRNGMNGVATCLNKMNMLNYSMDKAKGNGTLCFSLLSIGGGWIERRGFCRNLLINDQSSPMMKNLNDGEEGLSLVKKNKMNGKIQMMAEMMLNKKGQLNELLGVKITKLNMVMKEDRSNMDELFVEMSMKLSVVHMNAIGLVHGGSMATLCDTAIGTGALIFANQYLQGSGMVVLDNFNQFIKSASMGDELIVVAKPLHLGKSTQSWEATVYLGDPLNGKMVALSRSTIMNKTSSSNNDSNQIEGSTSVEKISDEKLNKLGKNFNIDTMSKQEIASRFDKYSDQWEFLTSISDYQKNVINWVVNELKQFSQTLPTDQTFKVLDLATGNGLIGRSVNNTIRPCVKSLEMTGLDLSQGMIQKAKEWNIYNNLFVHDLDQPITSLPYSECYDLITCFGVSEMLKECDKVLLSEISRLLSKNTQSQCWISFQFNDGQENTAAHQGMRTYTLFQITSMLQQYNLKILSHSTISNAYYLPSPKSNTPQPVPFIVVKCTHSL